MMKKTFILSLLCALVILPGFAFGANSKTWDFSTPGEYTYNSDYIEFSSGQAQLKQTANWYDSAWKFRKSVSVNSASGAGTNYPVKILIQRHDYEPDISDLISRNHVWTGDEGFSEWDKHRAEAACKGAARVSWTRFSNTPRISGDSSYGTPAFSEPQMPRVWYDGDSDWKMWFYCLPNGVAEICYAESADGETWYVLRECAISNKSGTFTSGESLSFAPSGAAGKYFTDDGTDLKYTVTSGTPTTSDSITGGNSGATCDIDTIDDEPPCVICKGAADEWDDYSVGNGMILKETSGTFKMWYQGKPESGLTYSIGLATSVNGWTWTKEGTNPVLEKGGGGTWEDVQVTTASVIREGDTYKMWYLGLGPSGSAITRVGLATSEDGVNWTKYENNPVATFYGEGGHFDEHNVEIFEVIRVGDKYLIFYEGDNNSYVWRLGAAWSHDGITWNKLCADSPTAAYCGIFDHNVPTYFDDADILMPSPVWHPTNKQWYLYYAGLDGTSFGTVASIGLTRSSYSLTGTTLYFDSNCQDDFDDLRFTDNDGTTELDYWIEEYEQDVDGTAWVEVADDISSSNTTIYAYYGHATASTGSDGEATFLFFDDFDDNSIDADKWDNTGTWLEQNYRLEKTPDSTTRVITTDDTFSYPIAIEWKGLFTHDGSTGWTITAMYDGSFASSGYIFGNYEQATDTLYLYRFPGGTSQSTALHPNLSNTWYKYKLTVTGTTQKGYIDDDLELTMTSSPPAGSDNVGLACRKDGAQAFDVYVDDFRVRKFTDPEPTIGNWGSHETVYPANDPAIYCNLGFAFTAQLALFGETATKPTGAEILYNISIDDGSTWKWWDGDSWETADGTADEANAASVVNENISSLGSSGTFKWKAFFAGDGTELIKLDNLEVSEIETYFMSTS